MPCSDNIHLILLCTFNAICKKLNILFIIYALFCQKTFTVLALIFLN